MFLYLKALHIIFIVTWFAGLFYIVRLFIYYAETSGLESPAKEILQNQYKIMQSRLWYGITWPSAVLTLVFGLWLVHYYGQIPGWLWVKLGFVAALYAYFGICHVIFNQQQKGVIAYSSQQLRVWNEVATIFLVAIVFLVVLRSTLSMFYGIIGLLVFTLVLLAAIFIYKKLRR